MRTLCNPVFWLSGVILLIVIALPASIFSQSEVGGRPANPDPDNERSESIFIFTAEPGSSQTDQLLVANNTSREKSIEIYPADGQTTNTGSFACSQRNEDKTEVGGWIDVARERITLEPGGQAEVDFDLRIPEGVDVGEHNGCIILEEVDDREPETDESTGVSLSFRSAIRVAVTVPGEIEKSLQFAGLEYTPGERETWNDQADYVISPTLQNRGNVSVDARTVVYMRNILGGETENSGTFPVFRDDSVRLNMTVKPSFWGGIYRVGARAEYDANPQSGIGMSRSEDIEVITSDEQWVLVSPTRAASMVILSMVLAVAGVIVVLWYRLASLPACRKKWGSYTVFEGEDIQSIARQHHIRWKKLARVNRISAPYTIKPGQTLLVPRRHKRNR